MRAGGGGEHQIHPAHGGIALLIGGDRTPGRHHGLPVMVAAQGDGDGAPRLVEQRSGQPSHLPIANDHSPFSGEATQRLVQPVHRRPGRRPGHPDKPYTGLDLLTGGGGVAEQRLQHPVRRARLPGGGGGGLHLRDNLVLPPDLGAQPPRHLHQVTGGLLSAPGDKSVGKGGVRHPGNGTQQPPRVRLRPRLTGQVELGAVAGGQQDAALHPLPAPQAAVQLQHTAAGEGQALPQVDGGLVPVQAGHNQIHACSPFLTSTTEK